MENQPTQSGVQVPAVPSGDLFGWIACSEKLPHLGKVVWLWEPGRKSPWIGSRDDASEVNDGDWLWGSANGSPWWNGCFWAADVEQDDDYQPTHWMPLPVPPSQPNTPDSATARSDVAL